MRRHEVSDNGPVAAAAKREAETKLREQMRRWPEVRRAARLFEQLTEQAMRGDRP